MVFVNIQTTTVGKAKWKPLELVLPRKIVNQKHYLIPGAIAKISAIIKDLKDTGEMVPTTSPFNTTIWPDKDRLIMENDS